MGWSFAHGATRRQVIDEITREQKTAAGGVFRTLKKCFRGNTMYALHESGPEGNTRKWIAVYLLQRSGGDWGYKPIEENMGPVQMDCPVSYLDEADEPMNQYAREWREAVRKLAAERAAKKPKVGEMWTYGTREIEIRSLRPLIARFPDQCTYRIKRAGLGRKVADSSPAL
jgi:hypothetical protein